MALNGIDISDYQANSAVMDAYDFVIIKASEGINWHAKRFYQHTERAVSTGKLIGFYHYGRPETGNSASREAQSFLNFVSPYIGKAVLALDIEQGAFRYARWPQWCKEWLDYVYSKTGVRPLLYIQGSECQKVKFIYDANYGIWAASSPSYYKGMSIAIQQNVYGNLDHDTFNGDKAAWLKYANPSGSASKPATPVKQNTAPAKPATNTGFHVGDTVIPTVLKDVHGTKLTQWDKQYTITAINGNNLTLSARGQVWAVLPSGNVRKVGSAPAPAKKTSSGGAIKVGDTVKVTNPINYDTGKKFGLYYSTYKVMELKGKRAVIGVNGTVTSAINVSNLRKV